MARTRDEKPFWIKFKPDHWEGGVAGLTPQAEYIYFRICKTIWSTGKSILLEQFCTLIRHFPDQDVYLNELVRSGKVTVSNGLIDCKRAKDAHKEAKNTLKKNRDRTKKAIEARQKQTLTPGKETENDGDRNMQRNVAHSQNSTEQNIHSSSSTEYKNSNSQIDDFERNVNYGDKVGTLKAKTYEEARDTAPGYDVYHIEQQWRDSGFASEAQYPDKAFLGFVRKHVERNPL